MQQCGFDIVIKPFVRHEGIDRFDIRVVDDRCPPRLRGVGEQDTLVRACDDELIDPCGVKIRCREPVCDRKSVRADEAFAEMQLFYDLVGEIPAKILPVRAVFAADEADVHMILEEIEIRQRIQNLFN